MNDIVGTLSEEEIEAMGLSDLVGSDVEDNPVVEAMIRGEARSDPRGRPVISFRQYLELQASGQRLDNFMMVMQGPTGKGLVQASKFQKWFGEGFRPPELADKEARATKVLSEKEAVIAERDRPTVAGKDEIIIYPCKDKYPECPRFFDTPRSRQTHWGMQHERTFKSRREK